MPADFRYEFTCKKKDGEINAAVEVLRDISEFRNCSKRVILQNRN
jgi:hypothetical protein